MYITPRTSRILDMYEKFEESAHNFKRKLLKTEIGVKKYDASLLEQPLLNDFKVPSVSTSDKTYWLQNWEVWETIIQHDWIDRKEYMAELFDCLMPDTPLVVKIDGDVTIKQVQELPELPKDTYVLDDGNWTKIEHVVAKKSSKPISVVSGPGGFLETTNDHRYFSNGEYKEISKLGKTPNLKPIEQIDFLDKEYFDKELAYAFGVFLAEGHTSMTVTKTSNKCWQWHMDMGELEVLERIKPIIEEYAGTELKIVLYPSHMKGAVRGGCTATKHMYRLKIAGKYGDGRILSELFRDRFYTKNGDKKIPDEILHADIESKKAFLEGFLDGDGWRKNEHVQVASSKSRVEAFGLYLLARQCGMMTRFDYDNRQYGNRKSCPVITISDRKEAYNNIIPKDKVVEEDRGDNIVYDITTESGHFYAGGFLVHNCDNFAFWFSSRMAGIYHLNSAMVCYGATYNLDGTKRSGHAFNLIPTIGKNGLEWYVYEPITDWFVKWEPGEKIIMHNIEYRITWILGF